MIRLVLLPLLVCNLHANSEHYNLQSGSTSHDFVKSIFAYHGISIKPSPKKILSKVSPVVRAPVSAPSAPNLTTAEPLKRFQVVSGSMAPTIPTGSFIYVDRNVSFDDIKEGDIVVYRTKYMKEHGSSNVVHRVVSKKGDVLYCKGDYNQKIDKEIVDKYNYVGKVVEKNSSVLFANEA
jgi:signal peptidase I